MRLMRRPRNACSPSGGVGLLRVRAAISALAGDSLDQNAGIKIVLRALEEPRRQIVASAGEEPSPILNRVLEGSGDVGYNAATGVFRDMFAMGVPDPCKAMRSALQNAASIAGLILTTNCMSAELRAEPAPAQAPGSDMDM